jgi:hypothetical protein
MTEEMHRTLIKQFCETVGLPDAEKLRADGTLLVDGFQVQLLRNIYCDGLLDIRVDLGAVPVERERDAYRTMLEINMATSQIHSGQIGIVGGEGERGDHAIFSAGMPVTTCTTGEDVAHALDHVLRQAQFVHAAMNGTWGCDEDRP